MSARFVADVMKMMVMVMKMMVMVRMMVMKMSVAPTDFSSSSSLSFLLSLENDFSVSRSIDRDVLIDINRLMLFNDCHIRLDVNI